MSNKSHSSNDKWLQFFFKQPDVNILERALIELSKRADRETLDRIEEITEYLHKVSRES